MSLREIGGLRPRLNQVDTGSGTPEGNALIAELKEAVTPITPESLTALRLFSASSAFLPLMLLASSDDGFSAPQLRKEANAMQISDDPTLGWQLSEGSIYDFFENLDRLGFLQRSTENTAIVRVDPLVTSLLRAVGGYFINAMNIVSENRSQISAQDILGKARYNVSQDAVCTRARIYTALVRGFEKTKGKAKITIDDLAKILDMPLESLRSHIVTLSREFGLIEYDVKAKNEYTLLERIDPKTLPSSSDRKRSQSQNQMVYEAILALLPEGNFSLETEERVTSDQIREYIRANHKDAPVLKDIPTGGDSVAHALYVLQQQGLIRTDEPTSVYLSQEQFNILAPFVQLIAGLVNPDDAFLTTGKSYVDAFLQDSSEILRFMTTAKELSTTKGAEAFRQRKSQVLRYLTESGGYVSSNELAELVGETLKYMGEIILRPFRKQGLIVSRHIPHASNELEWGFIPFIEAERLLKDGGMIVIEKQNRTSTHITRTQIRAIGKDDMEKVINALSPGNQETVRDMLDHSGNAPVVYRAYPPLPSGKEQGLLVIKPGKLVIYKNDETNPTLLDSNAMGNLSLLLRALSLHAKNFFEAKNISSEDIFSAIQASVTTIALRNAVYQPAVSIEVDLVGHKLFYSTGIPLLASRRRTRDEILFEEESDSPDDSSEE